MKTVAIAGVGLIGGSFALALRRAGFDGEILGVSSPATIAEAVERRVIDRGVDLAEAAAADVLFLAQPILSIIDSIAAIAPFLGEQTLVTDAGSTKFEICSAAALYLPEGQFIGGHPMAGKESRGVASADASLFNGRPWALTQVPPEPLNEWLKRIGAKILILSAEEHDRTVALTSHLPQLLATALAGVVGTELDSDRNINLSGPGLVDMTRLALSPFEMWHEILTTNRDNVDAALVALIKRIEKLRVYIDQPEMSQLFDEAAALRKKLVRSVPLR